MLGSAEHDQGQETIERARLLLDQLSREYQILQDKIDKIAGFKFTIRGWSVTIVVASSIGAATAKLPSPFLLLWLIVFVLAFCYMESIQTRHRKTFGRRCAEIERLIWRSLRGQGSFSAGMVPRIAHELADDSRARLMKYKNQKIRGIVKEFGAHDEYFFCAVQIAVIVGLTIWLASHVAKQEAVASQQVVPIDSIKSKRDRTQISLNPSAVGKKGENGSSGR